MGGVQVASWDPRCPLLCGLSNVVNMRPFISWTPRAHNGLGEPRLTAGEEGGDEGESGALVVPPSLLYFSLSPTLSFSPSILLSLSPLPPLWWGGVSCHCWPLYSPQAAPRCGAAFIRQGASECRPPLPDTLDLVNVSHWACPGASPREQWGWLLVPTDPPSLLCSFHQ